MESARHIENVHLGQKFETRETIKLVLMGNYTKKVMKWVVTEIYPFFIRARAHAGNGNFETRCFSIGDLVVLGLIPKGVMDE